VIICAVVASNIHWHWTPNGYLASAIGVGFAWALTPLINHIQDLRRKGHGAPQRL
jgi:hypothetical protein